MLVLGRVARDRADADRQVREAIGSGAGLERFRRIIEQQGGDPYVVDDYGRLPSATERCAIVAPRAGFLTQLDAELIGRASVALGAGRDRVEDHIDPAVGVMIAAKPGAELWAGAPVLELHYRDRARLEAAVALAERSIAIGDAPPTAKPLIVDEVF
jgi:thymidine phosphorylase